MKTTMKRLLMLCLLTVGMAKATRAQHITPMSPYEDNTAYYNLYYSYYDNGYGGKWMEQYYATIFKFISPLLGFAKIPETVTSQGHTFTVRGFGNTG